MQEILRGKILRKKEWKDFSEQVEYVKIQKKVKVSNPKELEQIFRSYNYSNIITPYKVYFHEGKDSAGNHIYKQETDIQKYYEYHKEDKMFSRELQQICYEFETFITTGLIFLVNRELESNDKFWKNRISEIKLNLKELISESDNEKKDEWEKSIDEEEKVNNIEKNNTKLKQSVHIYNQWLYLKKDKNDIFLQTKESPNRFHLYFSLELGKKIALFTIFPESLQKEFIAKVGFPKINDVNDMNTFLNNLREVRNTINHCRSLTCFLDDSYLAKKKYKFSKNPVSVIYKKAEEFFRKSTLHSDHSLIDSNKCRESLEKLKKNFEIRQPYLRELKKNLDENS